MKRVVKTIKVDLDKCTGCKACEVACSAFHAEPKYSTVNPAKSRIRVHRDEFGIVFLPVRAGAYTKAECAGRQSYIIGGREYGECDFCNASCPWRDFFKDPDSGLPLRCDMCESDPPLDEPMCVKWCLVNALTYEEREEEVEEEPEIAKAEDLEAGIELLVDRYGLDKVIDAVNRIVLSKEG